MESTGRHKVLFAGGGTGGHLMPAINIALALRRKDEELQALFVGKKGGMEAAIVNRFGFKIKEIEVVALKRNLIGALEFILKWNRGINQALNIIDDFRPQVVVGTGGYVSAPVVRGAYKRGIPIFMQEQNSLPGLATRTLGRMAKLVFIAYEGATQFIPKEKCRLVGNPIRPDLQNADKETAFIEFDLDRSKKTLLVVGGSSGARGINNALLDIVNHGSIPSGWQLLWQTGLREFERVKGTIDNGNFRGRILPFIDNMPGAYAIADLIVSRSGAMALAEIAVCGLPSILIPYPYATGDHQTLNAEEFSRTGAAMVIPETQIGNKLAAALDELLSSGDRRSAMARNAKLLARPEAADIITDTILEKMNEV